MMVSFLSALFSSPAQAPGGLDAALIDKGIDRVVAGTDRRLCALGDYREKLREPVERAGRHVIALVDALPPPDEISPQAFGEDPRLRALFVSPAHLGEVFGGCNSVRDYLDDLTGPPPDEIFGLLTTVREERTVFAMELAEDALRRDVMQVAVNFSGHRYLGPSASEADARRELKKRAFDFLIGKALQRLMDERDKRREMDKQRHLLKQKLDAMKSGRWGLDVEMENALGRRPNLAELEAEMDAIDAELGRLGSDNLSLEESLDCVIDTLNRPADWLAAREISLRLDYRGIKVQDSAATPANDIALTELISGADESRTVFFGRIARSDIPEAKDFWQTAKRYL